MNQTGPLKIGTRGSKLALWQARHVQAQLHTHWPDLKTECVVIKTSGDWSPADGETRLSEREGGKAQFAKEIEDSLLRGDIDIAVHSMKDMDSVLPDGLEIPCILPREDARDALLFRDRTLSANPADWPAGTTVGTASLRRQAMLLALNPQLTITTLRGNVGTRLDKLRGNQAKDFPALDITLLAVAGLNRLNMHNEIDWIIPPEILLPAASQGAIGIEIASKNKARLAVILAPLTCIQTQLCVTAERAVLAHIGGTCHTPIGIHGTYAANGALSLSVHILSADGTHSYKNTATAAVETLEHARNLGKNLGDALLSGASSTLLEQSL